MIKVTEAASKKVLELMDQQEKRPKGLRIVALARSPLSADFNLAFVGQEEDTSEDQVFHVGELDVYVDPVSMKYLEDAQLDYVDTPMGKGFQISAKPPKPPKLEGPLAEKVQKLIDEQINPALAMHGGYVGIIDLKGTVLYIELGGGCRGCGMVDVTLKEGIEKMIKQAIPEITEVYDVTDHAGGTNPYYRP